jgi:hypothetical protein
MKNWKQFKTDLPFVENILLGRTVLMGDRKARIVSVVSVGETSRYDFVYSVKFQDGVKVEMHDSQIRPFLEEHGAGEEATDELDDTYREGTPGEELDEGKIDALWQKFLKKIKMREFDRSERARKKEQHKKNVKYNKMVGIPVTASTEHDEESTISEDSPANAVGGGMSPHFGGEGGVQGTDAHLGKKKKRKKFAGEEVFELNSDEYHQCMNGRKKFERWSRKMNMEDIDNQEIRSFAHKNPGSAIIIQDKTTGIMAYLKHGDKK